MLRKLAVTVMLMLALLCTVFVTPNSVHSACESHEVDRYISGNCVVAVFVACCSDGPCFTYTQVVYCSGG